MTCNNKKNDYFYPKIIISYVCNIILKNSLTMKKLITFSILFLICLTSVKSQEVAPVLSSEISDIEVTELRRENNKDGTFLLELLVTYTGAQTIKYMVEQDRISNVITGYKDIPNQTTLIFTNLRAERDIWIYFTALDKEDNKKEYTYTLSHYPTGIESDHAQIQAEKYKVYSLTGNYIGTFSSLDKFNSDSSGKGLYIIQELDTDNKILRTGKHILN